MNAITHIYRCFGCEKEYEREGDAVTCCAVVQEIWRCKCGEEFSTEQQSVNHLQTVNHEILQLRKGLEAKAR